MEFQLGVGVLNFLCMVTLRIKQGETKEEWNGKVQIVAGADRERQDKRLSLGKKRKRKGWSPAKRKRRRTWGSSWKGSSGGGLPGKRVTFNSDQSRERPRSASPSPRSSVKSCWYEPEEYLHCVSYPSSCETYETALKRKPKWVNDEKLIEWLENLEQARTEMWSGHLWTRPADAIDPRSHQSGKDFWIAFPNNMRHSKQNMVCFHELCIAVLAIMLCCHEAVKVLISRQELGSAPLLASRP